MTIKTRILFKDYCKLLFKLAYRKPVLKIIVAVGIAMIIWIVGYYAHLIPVPKPEIYQYITLALIALVQPAAIYWMIKRTYDSSNHLAEQLEIEITPNEINVRGESFYTVLAWDKIFKVEEEKGYILIYQNNLSAIIISKNDLSEMEMAALKELLKGVAEAPIHLR